MMSARGTITSAIRRSRSPRIFLSIALSSGEKPVSLGAPSSSTSLRSARIEPARQPNMARSQRANTPLARFARSRQRHGKIAVLGCSGQPDRCDSAGSVSGMASRVRPRSRVRARDRHAEPRENRGFQIAPCRRLAIGLVVVAEQMKITVHGEMREMMREGLSSAAASRATVSIGDHDVAEMRRLGMCRAALAGNDSTLVGLSMPRHCALSARIAASSVSTTASSPGLLDASRAADCDRLPQRSPRRRGCRVPRAATRP